MITNEKLIPKDINTLTKFELKKIVNREQLKEMRKKLGVSKNISKEQLNHIIESLNLANGFYENAEWRWFVEDGEQVKINVARIKNSKLWDNTDESYKEFILSNEDTVFHALYEESYDKKDWVTLKEDTKDPKWLFSPYDLLVINPATDVFTELFNVRIDNENE